MTTTTNPDAIVNEIQIMAQPEQVFQALIEPSKVVQWWGQVGTYRCTKFQADLRAGGKWSSSGIGPDGGPFEVYGEYLEVDAPRLLVYTWIASWTGDAKTVVRCELIAKENGTLLRIRHSGLSAYPELAQKYQGWPRLLEWLRDYLETGATVDTREKARLT